MSLGNPRFFLVFIFQTSQLIVVSILVVPDVAKIPVLAPKQHTSRNVTNMILHTKK